MSNRMYSTTRIVVTPNSNDDIIQMFIEAMDRLSKEEKANAPDVVSRLR